MGFLAAALGSPPGPFTGGEGSPTRHTVASLSLCASHVGTHTQVHRLTQIKCAVTNKDTSKLPAFSVALGLCHGLQGGMS